MAFCVPVEVLANPSLNCLGRRAWGGFEGLPCGWPGQARPGPYPLSLGGRAALVAPTPGLPPQSLLLVLLPQLLVCLLCGYPRNVMRPGEGLVGHLGLLLKSCLSISASHVPCGRTGPVQDSVLQPRHPDIPNSTHSGQAPPPCSPLQLGPALNRPNPPGGIPSHFNLGQPWTMEFSEN